MTHKRKENDKKLQSSTNDVDNDDNGSKKKDIKTVEIEEIS